MTSVPNDPSTHTPVAAGPAYIETIRRLPSTFTATLKIDPDNRFNLTAVAVLAGADKIGYLPADLSRSYFQTVKERGAIECPGRHAPSSAEENTGVDVLLDLSAGLKTRRTADAETRPTGEAETRPTGEAV